MPLGMGSRVAERRNALGHGADLELGQFVVQLVHLPGELADGDLAFAAAAFNHVDGDVGKDAGQALALGVDQRLDPVCWGPH